MERRVADRVGDVPDADVNVLKRQLRMGAGHITWPKLTATGTVAGVVDRSQAHISRRKSVDP
ncbi:hypothetical protein METY_1027 [Methylopila sp. Yamaguchi]|nr:hypothetical protein METY_1027 [Methylopila sp. Yamaguchi]